MQPLQNPPLCSSASCITLHPIPSQFLFIFNSVHSHFRMVLCELCDRHSHSFIYRLFFYVFYTASSAAPQIPLFPLFLLTVPLTANVGEIVAIHLLPSLGGYYIQYPVIYTQVIGRGNDGLLFNICKITRVEKWNSLAPSHLPALLCRKHVDSAK